MPELRCLKENVKLSQTSMEEKKSTPRRKVEVVLLLIWLQHDNASLYLMPQGIILSVPGPHSCLLSLLGK